MPMKYMYGNPMPVKYLGWAHGVLFIAYGIQLLIVGIRLKWSEVKIILGGVAALLPFGPFVFEWAIQKESRTV